MADRLDTGLAVCVGAVAISSVNLGRILILAQFRDWQAESLATASWSAHSS